ncbi:MAG: MerR family transcriptional regulator [Bacteroidales bacterium]|nr:MerR family transcriptional regulator [Bacteroidales bacterium]
MGDYSIKDLERLSGIKAHTIRIWEKRYGLVEPGRSDTNIRHYNDSDLKKLLNISTLNRNGLKISKIAQLTNSDISALVEKFSENPHNTGSQLESLYMSMIDLDEELFEKIINRAIIQMGFERMYIDIMYPFFNRMGIMWQTGTISPAQEHFVSNLIRQKCLVAIDSVVPPEKPGAKTFTLFLPENELHELGLLFMHYVLKKRGHRVIYLGAMLPLDNLVAIEKFKPSDYWLASIVTAMETPGIDQYVKSLSQALPGKKIILTGLQAEKLKIQPKNIVVLHNIKGFIDFIGQL